MSKLRPAPLIVAAIILLVGGVILQIHGSELVTVGEVKQAGSSTATFGDILGFETDASTYDERAEGAANISDGHLFQGLSWFCWASAATLTIAAVRSRRRKPATAIGGPPARVAPAPAPHPGAGGPAVETVPRYACPSCGESIAKAAKVCRFCGVTLTPTG